MKEIKGWEVLPELHFINNFYRNEKFIEAFSKKADNFDLSSYDHILFSYHGLPERHMRKTGKHYGDNSCKLGDCCHSITDKNQFCYRANCFETTRRIADKLNLQKEKYSICFQSRLGRDPWIQPYTDETIKRLAKSGKKRILVFSPSFVADCLETVHEIGVEYNELFEEYGGEKIDLVPSLNSDDLWVEAVKDILNINN
jgi:ferrochelatase